MTNKWNYLIQYRIQLKDIVLKSCISVVSVYLPIQGGFIFFLHRNCIKSKKYNLKNCYSVHVVIKKAIGF